MDYISRTILLVEDEMIIALNEKRWLKDEGYKVIHVMTGEKAIEIVNSAPDAVDLILMDIDLGPGIDGTTAANEILKNHDLPVLFLSFHTEKEIVDKTKSVTSYGFIYKGSENTIKLASIEVALRLFDAKKSLHQRKMELRRAKEELQNTNKMLHHFITHAGVAIAVFDREMRYLYVSDQFLKEYRLTGKNIIGIRHYDVFPDVPERWKNVHWQSLNGISVRAEEDIFPRADGSVEWIRWECRPWYISEGVIGGIILNSEVITERKKAEDTILKLTAIFRNIKRGIVVWNAKTRSMEFCNPEFARMHGYAVDGIKGKKFEEIYSPDEIGHISENLKILEKKGVVNFETVHTRKDGSEFPVQVDIAAIYDEKGEITFTVANILDITEKIEFAAKLRASESSFHSVFNYASTGITLLTLSGEYLKVNNAYCQMTGYTEAELFRMTFFDITHPDDAGAHHANWNRLAQGETESFQMEKRYLHKSGKVFWVLLNASPVLGDDKKPLYLIGQMQDITAMKEAELQVAEYAEKLKASNAEKEKYFSILSHDLRGPVSGFVGLSNALMNDLDLLTKEEIRDFSRILYSSSKKVQSLLLDLLEWSQLQRGEPTFESTEFGISTGIDGIIGLYSNSAEEKSISLVNNFRSDLIIKTDRKVFDTIMRNLISNAIKFTNRNGSVTVSGSYDESFVYISVSDTGVGISADMMEKTFTIGSAKSKKGTNNEEGTGLGLILCHELIIKSGGEMSIESTPGEGTTVSFSLPAEKGI